jgi:hypothetical protein
VSGTGSGLGPKAGFGISGFESSYSPFECYIKMVCGCSTLCCSIWFRFGNAKFRQNPFTQKSVHVSRLNEDSNKRPRTDAEHELLPLVVHMFVRRLISYSEYLKFFRCFAF